jgi:hypothetical protein
MTKETLNTSKLDGPIMMKKNPNKLENNFIYDKTNYIKLLYLFEYKRSTGPILTIY